MNRSGQKRLMLMGYIINANRQKILLKEQEESKNRICFFSKEDKNEINMRIRNKNTNLKRKFIKR